jgi:ABC-type uncharacterized transport system ATPase subunit
MTTDPAPLVQMANITKTFPGGVVANDDISLAVWEGTIHAIIGENGAGKSTLMNVLYGRYQPDRGRIRIRGQDVRIESPARAIALGMGMVTQHTTLIPALTALDNVILGAEPAQAGIVDRKTAATSVDDLANRLGVRVDWSARAETLSVAALQKAEIVKALYRGASLLILDEPTTTLAPQEADALFALLHSLVESGMTVIFITHKLREVMAHSSRVTVLRGGRMVGERLTGQTYPEDLLGLMLGQRVTGPGVPLRADQPGESPAPLPWERGPLSEMLAPPPALNAQRPTPNAPPPVPVLEIRDVHVLNDRRAPAVRGVTLSVAPGEVLGVAGVDGSGQRELAEAIVGLRPPASGAVWLDGKEISRAGVDERLRRGLAYIPEDRQREGLILDFSLAENLLLGRQRSRLFGGGAFLSLRTIEANGNVLVREHRILAPGADVAARTLSGGNQQKVVLARALEGAPRLLVAMQPTRGLDVDATRFVYKTFRDALARGLAILLFSLDLDEVFEISDRIAVMYNGTLAGVVSRAVATPDDVGRMMVTGRMKDEG